MGVKRQKLYKYISACAAEAVDNLALSERVSERFPDVSNRQIMKASLLAFTDRKLKDEGAFAKICEFAISKRKAELPEPADTVAVADALQTEPVAISEQPAPVPELANAPKAADAERPVTIKLVKPRVRKLKNPMNGISPS